MEIVVEEDKEEEPTLASRVGSKWISSEPKRTGVVYVSQTVGESEMS
jgi:hypothetical protein